MPTTTTTVGIETEAGASETKKSQKQQRGVVASLRALTPRRPLTFSESVRVAELQAFRLLQLTGCRQEDGHVPESVITGLPRLDVRQSLQITGSGVSLWRRGMWHVRINALESFTRQRFSLAHELKHIIDAAHEDVIYRDLPTDSEQRHKHIEAVCDAFAAALLMPRAWVRRLWYQGTQDPGVLAWHFQVSQQAMQIRLQTLGLIPRQQRSRCSHSSAYRLGQTAVQSDSPITFDHSYGLGSDRHTAPARHVTGRLNPKHGEAKQPEAQPAEGRSPDRHHQPLPDLQYIPDPDYVAATELEGVCV